MAQIRAATGKSEHEIVETHAISLQRCLSTRKKSLGAEDDEEVTPRPSARDWSRANSKRASSLSHMDLPSFEPLQEESEGSSEEYSSDDERDISYDAMVLRRLKRDLGELRELREKVELLDPAADERERKRKKKGRLSAIVKPSVSSPIASLNPLDVSTEGRKKEEAARFTWHEQRKQRQQQEMQEMEELLTHNSNSIGRSRPISGVSRSASHREPHNGYYVHDQTAAASPEQKAAAGSPLPNINGLPNSRSLPRLQLQTNQSPSSQSPSPNQIHSTHPTRPTRLSIESSSNSGSPQGPLPGFQQASPGLHNRQMHVFDLPTAENSHVAFDQPEHEPPQAEESHQSSIYHQPSKFSDQFSKHVFERIGRYKRRKEHRSAPNSITTSPAFQVAPNFPRQPSGQLLQLEGQPSFKHLRSGNLPMPRNAPAFPQRSSNPQQLPSLASVKSSPPSMLHPSFPNISPRNSQEGAASHSPSHHASANVWQGGKAASRRWQSNAQSHPGPVPPSHNSSHHISGSALQGGGKAAPPRLLQPLNPLSKAIAALQPNRERQAVSTSQIQLPPLPHIKDSKVNLTATGRIKSARILANMLSGVQLVGQELQHMREKAVTNVMKGVPPGQRRKAAAVLDWH